MGSGDMFCNPVFMLSVLHLTYRGTFHAPLGFVQGVVVWGGGEVCFWASVPLEQ